MFKSVLILALLFSISPVYCQYRLSMGFGLSNDFEEKRNSEAFVPYPNFEIGLFRDHSKISYGIKVRHHVSITRYKCSYVIQPGDIIPSNQIPLAGNVIYGYDICSHEATFRGKYLNLLVGLEVPIIKSDKIIIYGSLYAGPELFYQVSRKFETLTIDRNDIDETIINIAEMSFLNHELKIGSRFIINDRCSASLDVGYYSNQNNITGIKYFPNSIISFCYSL